MEAHTYDHRVWENRASRPLSLTEERNQGPDGLDATDYDNFERWLFDSIQAFQIIASHATVDGVARKPLRSLEHLTDYLKARVDVYQNAPKTRQCTPRAIYWMQWATSTYILFGTLTDLKKCLNDPRGVIIIAEETERTCFEQINYTCSLLDTLALKNDEEIVAIRSLLKLRFCTVSGWGITFGMLYTSAVGVRPRDGMRDNSSDISCDETIHLASKAVNVWNNPDDTSNMHFREYLLRFGATYPKQLMTLLEMFIECTKMELNGISFCPPPRSLGLECVSVCKNLLENNVIRIKSFGTCIRNFPSNST
ncbi:hypothetical protein N7449_009324 [Penicillium cf. viridicatum]|uniref:Uncharacterized protein n=1 Tax=Penicillium cf. viridicatum TaxID=2972119 RepID=A0A9W9JBS3_9EURO|nr:hypothetical protein N7449_009324 [Penicillium cf. viridicatum]